MQEVNVTIGDKVKQGDVIGTAGSNNYDPASGVHVHFKVLKGEFKINPNELIGKKLVNLRMNKVIKPLKKI